MADLDGLKRIAEVEFASIVKDTIRMDFKLRVILLDNSFADIFLSEKLPDKFGFHWERMDLVGTIYRYDNVPDQRWKNLATFPFHFHRGSQDKVEESPFPQSPDSGFRAFMKFVEEQLKATPAP